MQPNQTRSNKLKFRFQWYNENQTILQLIPLENWNWRDYHAGARAAAFSIATATQPVHTLIDLRESTRSRMPSGLYTHMRSFGRKISENLSGIAVIIDLPPEDYDILLNDDHINSDDTFTTTDGILHFAKDEETLCHILATL